MKRMVLQQGMLRFPQSLVEASFSKTTVVIKIEWWEQHSHNDALDHD